MIDCVAVVMDEEIEHYRFAVRDLAVLEASQTINREPEANARTLAGAERPCRRNASHPLADQRPQPPNALPLKLRHPRSATYCCLGSDGTGQPPPLRVFHGAAQRTGHHHHLVKSEREPAPAATVPVSPPT